MRPTISVFIATSLDGFIARPDGAIDWLTSGPQLEGEDFGYEAFMADVDLLVMGRHTFEQVLTFPEWPYGQRRVVVLTSHAWEAPEHLRATVSVRGGRPGDLVAGFEAEGVRHVYLDGGVAIQRFLAAGLVDDLTITRVPVLLGAGRPLFGGLSGDLRVQHDGTRVFANGYVQSQYRLTGPR